MTKKQYWKPHPLFGKEKRKEKRNSLLKLGDKKYEQRKGTGKTKKIKGSLAERDDSESSAQEMKNSSKKGP